MLLSNAILRCLYVTYIYERRDEAGSLWCSERLRALPEEHWIRLRTNNGLERLHEELRRRTRVVRIFPNRASCLRLCTALSMEQSEEWITGHRHLDMNVLEEEQPEMIELAKQEAVAA